MKPHRSVNHPQQNLEDVYRPYQMVISKATMMSSFRTSAVNEIETMFRNSFSNRIKDMIIIADPTSNETPEINILAQGGQVETGRPW